MSDHDDVMNWHVDGSDVSTEGTWLLWNGLAMTYTLWDNSYFKPSGGTAENCIALLTNVYADMWHDVTCAMNAAFIYIRFNEECVSNMI
jgi:hypothetical protein